MEEKFTSETLDSQNSLSGLGVGTAANIMVDQGLVKVNYGQTYFTRRD